MRCSRPGGIPIPIEVALGEACARSRSCARAPCGSLSTATSQDGAALPTGGIAAEGGAQATVPRSVAASELHLDRRLRARALYCLSRVA